MDRAFDLLVRAGPAGRDGFRARVDRMIYREAVELFSRRFLTAALRRRRGNRRATAADLGMSKYGMLVMMRRLGVDIPSQTPQGRAWEQRRRAQKKRRLTP